MVTLRMIRLAAAAMAVLASGLAVGACNDDPPTTKEAVLLAPPGVPPAPGRANAHVVVHLEAIEKQVEIAPGVQYTVWTFNGSVPGPLIRVKKGDEVEVHLKNSTGSAMTHNIDLHAVNGPGGGAGVTTVAPGEEKTFQFLVMAPGLYVYHCAAGIVADHIANGMYGAILVEPPGGLERVDHEYYIGQSEFYTTGDTNQKGVQELDNVKLLAEAPTYVVFNGQTKGLIGANALTAKTGETVRLFVANGGPNLISSFHVIGEIFDKTWEYGSLGRPMTDIQTVLVPPGGAAIVEFKTDVPGDYKLVDHAISRVSKGGVGTLHVEGPANARIFLADASAGSSSHDMTPEPAAVPVPESNTLKVAMKDNVFDITRIEMKAGQKAVFELTNPGKAIHNMRIADTSGSYDGAGSVVSEPLLINPGKSGKLTFEAPTKAGVFKFRCDVHPEQMIGTITVK